MAHSTMLHVRVDDEIKTQASEALAAMGLSVSDAVRILLKRVVKLPLLATFTGVVTLGILTIGFTFNVLTNWFI